MYQKPATEFLWNSPIDKVVVSSMTALAVSSRCSWQHFGTCVHPRLKHCRTSGVLVNVNIFTSGGEALWLFTAQRHWSILQDATTDLDMFEVFNAETIKRGSDQVQNRRNLTYT
jgi:hypothetical protein